MASTTVTIPNFNFTGFYYAQILEALIQYKRSNVPELTDESEFEPSIQLLRAFACVGHLNNTLIDLIANENTLPTASLVETVRNMLRLIDYELSSATPATVEILYKLSAPLSTSVEVVPQYAQASTERTASQEAILFEADSALSPAASNNLTAAVSDDGGTLADRTAALISLLAGNDFAPWVTPAVGDMMYFGHSDVMWDKLNVDLTTPAVGVTGVWEFYEGDWLKTAPDLVTPAGSTIRFNINGLLGTSPRPGTTVRATVNETGTYQAVVSQWDGTYNFIETGLLGQSSPSTTEADYSVGSDWTILDDVVDGTSDLTADGDVSYTIPQSVTKNWAKTTVNSVSAYWLRYRVVVISTPTAPVFRTANINTGNQYVIRQASQGQSVEDNPLGSSTGLPDQQFSTTRDNHIDDSGEFTVDGEVWTEVDNFVNSKPGDKHYVVQLGDNDRATILTGSGKAGKVPPIGVNNVDYSYRVNAHLDGNVGPGTITVDKQGLTAVESITNPRQASGWGAAEGATEASLEAAKINGPASLRVKTVAVSPDDVETLAKSFTNSLGVKPYSRALAIEEGFGPKTVELVVVSKGGGLASSTSLDELDEYFNGDKFSVPQVAKKIVANQEVTSVNYTQKSIDIVATVTTNATAEAIKNRLNQVITPEALKSDGVTWEWEFGGDVFLSRISHEIFETDESTTKVVLTTPAADVSLGSRELPIAGTITITVVAP